MSTPSPKLNGLIVGGGIAGLALAHALGQNASHRFDKLSLWERADVFDEVGAGVQLGPNATRVLLGMGLGAPLAQWASQPQSLAICSATHNDCIAERPLGQQTLAQYGAPAYTIHRADLHQILLTAVQQAGQVDLKLNHTVATCRAHDQGVELCPTHDTHSSDVTPNTGATTQVDLLMGCDGGFSTVRSQVLQDGPPTHTGQIAFRALLPISQIPPGPVGQRVTAWLGHDMHAVGYPVRAGTLYNLVVIVQVPLAKIEPGWEQRTVTAKVPLATAVGNRTLAGLMEAVTQWRSWALFDRPPVKAPSELCPHPRVVLLGDAAHPMLPFLAQGAAMAIEDADALARQLGGEGESLPMAQAGQAYAQARWQRCARVQAGARRNAQVFHYSGPMAWARDLALRVRGQNLLDYPWLYGVGRR